MAQNELQKDFTQFVGQIIEQINKDIYMEELKSIYDSYMKCLDNLKTESENIAQTGDKMNQNQWEVVDSISDIQKDLTEKTKQIEDALKIFYDGYEKILKQYEDKIVSLNKKERTVFIKQITDTLEQTHDSKIETIEQIFSEYTDKLQNMSDSVAKAEQMEAIVSEMALTREIVQESVSDTYIKTLTNFEERIADLNVKEREEVSLAVKAIFEEENKNLKKTVENYSDMLHGIASEMMSHEDLTKFHQNLTQYTSTIQYLAEQRYTEVLRAFEHSLSEMGKVQFEKYLESINNAALKSSDLEAFLEQIKLLLLSIKTQVKESEKVYIQLFDNVKNGIETLNEAESEKFLKTLSAFFVEQIMRLNEAFDRHEQMIEQYKEEQESSRLMMQKMIEVLKKNHTNTKTIIQSLLVMKEQEERVESKLNTLHTKIGEQTLKQQYLMKEMDTNKNNTQALFLLNLMQFVVIVLLFLMNGAGSNILQKIAVLVVLLIAGIGLLIRKKN